MSHAIYGKPRKIELGFSKGGLWAELQQQTQQFRPEFRSHTGMGSKYRYKGAK